MASIPSSSRFLSAQTDLRLVQLIRDGHERAFDTLAGRYRRLLLSYCLRLTGTHAAAEDALQQALLLAWSAIRSGVEVRDVNAWLYRIAHNVAISNLRRSEAATHDAGPDVARHGEGPDQELELRSAARDALAGLAALPEPQRRVMLATALEGRTHQELARALGLSSAAVRGLVYRARATLRGAAAALAPWPLVRVAGGGDGPGAVAGVSGGALTGGGGAGIAGLLLKGGALVVTAGALAGAAGLGPARPPQRARASGTPLTRPALQDEPRLGASTRSTGTQDVAPAASDLRGTPRHRQHAAAVGVSERGSTARGPRNGRAVHERSPATVAAGVRDRSEGAKGTSLSGGDRAASPRDHDDGAVAGQPLERSGSDRASARRLGHSRQARHVTSRVDPATALAPTRSEGQARRAGGHAREGQARSDGAIGSHRGEDRTSTRARGEQA